MYVNDREKGNRNEIEGKHIRGFTDVFYPDGQAGRTFGRCGSAATGTSRWRSKRRTKG